jgi:hypothetical protein
MFKFLDLRDRLLIEQQKNAALQARNADLENALLELAEIVVQNETAIQEVQNG